MCDARQERFIVESERGFSLIEVLISMVVTLIVMAAVFGLLTRGQRSFQREPEVADLQQSARTALDLVTKDILQAGAGLPPEFPAFSRINGAGEISRDFCHVANVVQANLLAATVEDPQALNQAYNIAVGARSTLDELFVLLRDRLAVRHPGLAGS